MYLYYIPSANLPLLSEDSSYISQGNDFQQLAAWAGSLSGIDMHRVTFLKILSCWYLLALEHMQSSIYCTEGKCKAFSILAMFFFKKDE